MESFLCRIQYIWKILTYCVLLYAYAVQSRDCPNLDYKTYIHQFLQCISTHHYPDIHCSDQYVSSTLMRSMTEWTFSQPFLLFTELDVDPDTRNTVRQVRRAIFSQSHPTPLKSTIKLAALSKNALQNVLDIDSSASETDAFLSFVSGNTVLDGSTPLSHRYGGHQFGVWAGQLGDGRAHILGEYINRMEERWELQLKGSGLTPFSRSGDGRAVVRSSVREFLCSEAMYHLGVPTSRAVSIIVSDDRIVRDQFYNGNFKKERTAVVLRLAKSWIRFGSFEILTQNNEMDLLRRLADFVIKHHFPQIDINDEDRFFMLFSEVVEQTAEMIVKWQSIGFAHGVCNTDNFSILSITIDYGPFGFMEEYDPEFVPNTSDDEHQYSYEKQPDVGYYNLDKLRIALQPLILKNKHFVLGHILHGYVDLYKTKFMHVFRNKLGLINQHDSDENLIALLLKMMEDTRADFTMTFRQLGDWHLDLIMKQKIDKSLWSIIKLEQHEYFNDWLNLYASRILKTGITQDERKKMMHKTNPRYVLRNWIAEEVIRSAEKDDFGLIRKVLTILENPFEEQMEAELLGFADPPPEWSKQLKVSCSS